MAKFALKKQGTGEEYVVPALEGLWWVPDMAEFDLRAKESGHSN